MAAEHTVDRCESERVFEHANILFALTATDYIRNRWEAEAHFKELSSCI